MALLNNYYIFVQDESVKRGVAISTHPVENGLPLTDNVKREPTVISISGEIVGDDAKNILENIAALHGDGKLVKYIGQNIISNALITSFNTDHPNTIYGGCAFDMEISEVRIAKSPYTKTSTAKAKTSTVQVTKKAAAKTVRKYTVKRGDTLWAIAKKYYGSGAKYPKIVNANKALIKNPNKINVGWVLVIP